AEVVEGRSHRWTLLVLGVATVLGSVAAIAIQMAPSGGDSGSQQPPNPPVVAQQQNVTPPAPTPPPVKDDKRPDDAVDSPLVALNGNKGVDDTPSESRNDRPAEIAKSDTTKPTKSGPIEKVVDPLEKPSSDDKGGDNTENKTDTKTDAKTDTKADAKTENKTDTKTDTKDEKVPSPTPEKPRVAAERPAPAKKGCQPQGQV